MNLADRIPNDECLTIDELSSEVGMSIPRMRQLLTIAKDKKMIPWLVKKDGRAILYTPEFVKGFRELYTSGRLGKIRPRDKSVLRERDIQKHAKLIVTVPVFDEQEAKILEKKFGSKEEIMKFLVTKLQEVSRPGLKKINELKEKQKREMEELERSLSSL